MFPTISDIIGLWFVWSVREGNYYKAPAKLTIGRNLVEILRGGRRLLLAHLMSSWEAICQIFTTVGGKPKKLLWKVKQMSFPAKYENNGTDENHDENNGKKSVLQQNFIKKYD